MRIAVVIPMAVLLAGCGGEQYPVPAGQAYASLTEVGTMTGLHPLPAGLHDIAVNFEALPAENAVRWSFSHEGDDLAKIIARVEPDGDSASNVAIEYVDGSAPDEKWRNGQVRNLLRNGVQQLVVEAVDSKLEGRPFDMALRESVSASTVMLSAGAIMNDAHDAMEAEIARRDQLDRESEAAAAMNPYNATKPSMNLKKTN